MCPCLSCCPGIALCSTITLGECKGHVGHPQATMPEHAAIVVKFAMTGRYMDNANQYFEEYLPGPKRTVFHTRKGLSWRNAWGVLRYSANNAFIAFVHADQMKKQVIGLAQHGLVFAWRLLQWWQPDSCTKCPAEPWTPAHCSC